MIVVTLNDGFPLGTSWGQARLDTYPGGVARVLLFRTRSAARRWADAQHAKYADCPDGHRCRAWRFRVVRVRERVTVIRTTA